MARLDEEAVFAGATESSVFWFYRLDYMRLAPYLAAGEVAAPCRRESLLEVPQPAEDEMRT